MRDESSHEADHASKIVRKHVLVSVSAMQVYMRLMVERMTPHKLLCT